MLRTDHRTEGEEKAAKVNANKGCLQLLTQRVKQTMRRRRRRSTPQNRHCHSCSQKSTMMRNGSQARFKGSPPPKNRPQIEAKSMKNRVRAHPGQHLAAKRGPRAPKMRPRRAQETPKSAQERPKTAQEPPKRRPGDAQTPPKPALERSRTSFSRTLDRTPCSRSCGAVFFSLFASRAGCPTCSDVHYVPLLPMFCRVRSIHATVVREHAKAFKNLEK